MSEICDEDLPVYGANACAPLTLADSDALAFIKQNQTTITSYDNVSQWEAGILDNSVSIAKNISVSVPEPTPRTITNRRVNGPDNVHSGFNYVVEFEDMTVSPENTAYYKALNGQTKQLAWRLSKETQSLRAPYPFYIMVTPISGVKGDVLYYKGTATAIIGPNDGIEQFDTPAGIFDI
jgi:hypothetical protein